MPRKTKTILGFKLDSKGHYNGKPMEHWLAMADEMVMYAIVRGINSDPTNPVSMLAAERLKNLGLAINPALFIKLLEERDRCRANVPRIVHHILGSNGQALCGKHAPKAKRK